MSGLISSIAERLRESVVERRRALRRNAQYAARIPLRVEVLDATANETMTARPSLVGHTRDLSMTDLSLIVPAIRIDGSYITDQKNRLRITLDLPGGRVQILAASVRFEQLGRGVWDRGYLIGARITKMADGDRARYREHIRNLVPIEKRGVQLKSERLRRDFLNAVRCFLASS